MRIETKKALTIIELLVAIFILEVAFLAILGAFSLGAKIIISNKMITVAVGIAQEKLEEEFSKSYQELSIGTTTEDFGTISGFPSYKRITKINCVRFSDLSEVACDYDQAGDPEPIKEIAVLVSWRASLGLFSKEIEISSLVAKK